MPVVSENGRNGSLLSYRAVSNVLGAVLFAITLALLGWIKTSVDGIDSRLDLMQAGAYDRNIKIQLDAETLLRLEQELSKQIEAENSRDDAMQKDIAALQLQEGIQADWIAAHFHADRAIRRLR